MGIYLPNMEKMPRKGEMLVIFPDGTSYVCFNGMRERLTQTTAISILPHGRLIDADALRAKQQEDADLFQGSTAYCDKCRRDEAMNAVANIVNAPTVIEAEEGE